MKTTFRTNGEIDYTVIITGANRGIGYALARESLNRGYHTIMHGRSLDSIEKARNTLAQETGCNPEYFIAPLDDPSNYAPLAKIMRDAARGKPIALIQNAGIFKLTTNMTLQEQEAYENEAMQVMALAPRALSKELKPSLEVLISSTTTILNHSGNREYRSAKLQAEEDSITLAVEHGTLSKRVYLGLVETDATAALREFRQEKPEDIAKKILHLLRRGTATDLMIHPIDEKTIEESFIYEPPKDNFDADEWRTERRQALLNQKAEHFGLPFIKAGVNNLLPSVISRLGQKGLLHV